MRKHGGEVNCQALKPVSFWDDCVLIVGSHSDGSGVDESERSDTGSVDRFSRTECCPDEHRLFAICVRLRGIEVPSS
jgi:hypothetical protein